LDFGEFLHCAWRKIDDSFGCCLAEDFEAAGSPSYDAGCSIARVAEPRITTRVGIPEVADGDVGPFPGSVYASATSSLQLAAQLAAPGFLIREPHFSLSAAASTRNEFTWPTVTAVSQFANVFGV
jgi:hypothetical protein